MVHMKPMRIIWLLISVSLLIVAGNLWYGGQGTNSWVKSAAIFSSDYKYSYTIGGISYTGSRFVYGDYFNSYQYLKMYELNSLHEDAYVYVDPKNPNNAVVIQGPYWEIIIFLIVIGLLIMVITIFWKQMLEIIIKQSYLPTRKDWGGG